MLFLIPQFEAQTTGSVCPSYKKDFCTTAKLSGTHTEKVEVKCSALDRNMLRRGKCPNGHSCTFVPVLDASRNPVIINGHVQHAVGVCKERRVTIVNPEDVSGNLDDARTAMSKQCTTAKTSTQGTQYQCPLGINNVECKPKTNGACSCTLPTETTPEKNAIGTEVCVSLLCPCEPKTIGSLPPDAAGEP